MRTLSFKMMMYHSEFGCYMETMCIKILNSTVTPFPENGIIYLSDTENKSFPFTPEFKKISQAFRQMDPVFLDLLKRLMER